MDYRTRLCLMQLLLASCFIQPACCLPEPQLPGLAEVEQEARGAAQSGQYDQAEHLFGRAVETLEAAGHRDVRIINDLLALSNAYQQQGNYDAALSPCQKALSILNGLPAQQPDIMARALMSMGTIRAGQGRFDQARVLDGQALNILEKQYGAGSPHLVQCLINLTHQLSALAKYAEAEAAAKRAMDILRPDGRSPQLADLLQSLGEIKLEETNYNEAEPILKRALGMEENQTPPDYFNMATSLDRLAGVYQGLKRPEDAESVLNKAVSVARKADKPTVIKDRQVVWFLVKLANIYNVEGRHEQAETQLNVAEDISRTAFTPEHYVHAVILNQLASTYIQEGKYAEAEQFYRQVLTFAQEASTSGKLPKSGPFQLGVSAKETAEALVPATGQQDASMFKQALDFSKKSIGGVHPVVAQALSNLGWACLAQNKIKEAQSYYQQAFDMNKSVFGLNNRFTAGSLRSLANAYEKEESFDLAALNYQKALDILRKLDGNYGAEIIQCTISLARAYSQMGQQAKAEELLRQALAACSGPVPVAARVDPGLLLEQSAEQASAQSAAEGLVATALSMHDDKSSGKPDPLEATVLMALSRVLSRQSKYREAETMCRKALVIRRQSVGADAPVAAQSMVVLSTVLENEKKLAEAHSLMQEAVSICQKHFGEQSLQYAAALHKLAKLESLEGHAEDSKEHDAKADTIENAVAAQSRSRDSHSGSAP